LALRLPEGITDEVGACLTIKALTAHMLLRQVRAVRTGDALLIHAAAGGVGQHLVRWGKHLGAQVIATVGSREKEEIVRACGADHVILYRQQNFVERVAQLTGGVGVDVVYDSVGADTFFGSLDCLGYRGTLVNFGQSSGPVPPFAISLLSVRSNAVVRPMLFHYIRERHAFESMAHEAFTALEDGTIQARIDMRVPLSRAADAHIALESRSTSGAIILLPDA
jgi:NADPH2:quinone reductase